jgi:outer membrane protein assembly factor BamB
MYLSSPVLVGDLLFGLSNSRKGRFFCLDVPSGKTLWQSGGRQGDNAALVGAGGVLLWLTTGAELIVAAQEAKAFTALATYTVAESPTWAHPAVVGGHILVKDRETLTLWRLD